MPSHRKTDKEPATKYRTSRYYKRGEKWYFYTREGTMEGPFAFKQEAEDRLENYKKIMVSGFIPLDSNLSIQPLDLPQPK
jgi:hypothetical protein